MKILIDRKWKKPTYTISNLYIDDEWFCHVIEDTDRGLTQDTPVSKIIATKKKYPSQTAIPSGTYKITLDVISPKYKSSPFYQKNANGSRVPRLLDIPGFDGVLIHTGNTQKDSAGCLIVGKNTVVGKVLNSKDYFIKLYKILQTAKDDIEITIL